MSLPFPTAAVGWEVTFTVLLLLLEQGRLFLVSKGNLTELAGPALWGLGLALPAIIAHLYFLLWQTYVLRLDQILHAVGLVFVGFEVILAALTLPSFLAGATQF